MSKGKCHADTLLGWIKKPRVPPEPRQSARGNEAPASKLLNRRLLLTIRVSRSCWPPLRDTLPLLPGDFLGHADVPLLGVGLAALGRPGYINLGHGGDLAAGK